MRVSIAAIGRMKAGPERELVSRYLDRAAGGGKPLALTGFDVIELPESRASSSPSRKVDEAKALRAALPQGVVVMLDERGKAIDSQSFAQQILRWRDEGRPAISFVIGGADGIDPDYVRTADLSISFSPMVWPHQLVRIMLAEQLYRTTTILSGHPYHRSD
ncbi:MAG TPA: 23S rRNA (pseudouridine(1915)-N(3))-methyltransferase RlmH [Devosia sp.]|uniref:23S rRNA (pseudouridine(1915)-N(3))-methyltransferase RlmH n=1 Tax=Devosia sp. TaxID=1871048 RepID=UPI002F9402F2